MSGTSLDGLDLALCKFDFNEGNYSFKLVRSATIPYSKIWKNKLENAVKLSAENYFKLHAEYGRFIGIEINDFLKIYNKKPDFIGSHGHTVFHQPENGFTTQIGCGATISAITGISTICDFRSLDVALKGQGAPLVPIGDKLLFGKSEACLNIGGIANISFTKNKRVIAYDICVANMALNYLAEKLSLPYDRDGKIAATSAVDKVVLAKLNNLKFYKKTGAKSLGKEWFDKEFKVFIDDDKRVKKLLATVTAHIANVIAKELNRLQLKSVLITGGGAFNKYLISSISNLTNCKLVIPDSEIIAYKEAIIFGFLAYLRHRGEINSLKSVTGATKNNVGGAIYFG